MVLRLRWRHLIWLVILAGLTYVSLPFFYAGNYTWNLLHPACQHDEIIGIRGEWIEVVGEKAGLFAYWYVPAENGKVIVLVGGRDGMLSDWQHEVDALVEVGYGVAVLADPGCNLPTSSLGVGEAEQIVAVVKHLSETENVNWIGAAGFSAGASALAMAIPETNHLQAVVLMGNFSDLQSEIMYTLYNVGSVGWLGQKAVPFWYRLYTGKRVRDVSPIRAFKDYDDIDIFLIHGEYEAQRTQAEYQLQLLWENETVDAELWIVPGANHGMYYKSARDIYLERVVGFFDEN